MYTYGDQPNEREKNQDLLEQSENDISRKNTEQVAGERERERRKREGGGTGQGKSSAAAAAADLIEISRHFLSRTDLLPRGEKPRQAEGCRSRRFPITFPLRARREKEGGTPALIPSAPPSATFLLRLPFISAIPPELFLFLSFCRSSHARSPTTLRTEVRL